MTNTEAPRTIETKDRDKYGRTVYSVRTPDMRTKVVIVVRPKMAHEHDGKGRYMINDWQMSHLPMDAPGHITYAPTLKIARAIADSKIA